MSRFPTEERRPNTKLAIIVTSCVAAIFLIFGVIAYQRSRDAENARQKVAEEQRLAQAQQESERQAELVTQRARAVEEQRRASAAQKELTQRCGTTSALNIYMAYKTGAGQTIRAVDMSVSRVPRSEKELEAMPMGDCRQAIFLFEQGAAQMAQAFVDQPDGAQGAIIDAGFGKVVFADDRSVCQASVFPKPLGLGEVTCHDR